MCERNEADCRACVRRACNRTGVHRDCSLFDVPNDDDTERMRVELEGIGIGFEDFEQQAPDRFQRLAADPIV